MAILALLVSAAFAAATPLDAAEPIPTAQEIPAWFAPRAVPPPVPPPAPVPAVEPARLILNPSEPLHISLPSIGVESALMDLGLTSNKELEVPPAAYPAGWYTGAPTPGELGPAIIAGHVDLAGEVGVFHDLHRLKQGDEVMIQRADGSTAVFVVDSVEQYPKNEFPTATAYGNIDHAGLRLITCGGEFDWGALSHRDNIVVFASLDRVTHDS